MAYLDKVVRHPIQICAITSAFTLFASDFLYIYFALLKRSIK